MPSRLLIGDVSTVKRCEGRVLSPRCTQPVLPPRQQKQSIGLSTESTPLRASARARPCEIVRGVRTRLFASSAIADKKGAIITRKNCRIGGCVRACTWAQWFCPRDSDSFPVACHCCRRRHYRVAAFAGKSSCVLSPNGSSVVIASVYP